MSAVLVIAPHPDDEILGVGGTIAKRASSGEEVVVCIVTKGMPNEFEKELIIRTRAEDAEACRTLGVNRIMYLDYPANHLEDMPSKALNDSIYSLIQEIRPDELYIPHSGDIHIDHQITALSAMVASRPKCGFFHPKRVLSYEVISETGWNEPGAKNDFVPTVYEDISQQLDTKISALLKVKSQLEKFPHPRSTEAVKCLAMYRGSSVGVMAAEAFHLIREVC